MPKYYIHAEAFNLDHSVYDTHDISTIRGGSFILLDAVKRRLPEDIPDLKPIATAASKGVFTYDDPGDLAAQRTGMVQQVLLSLHDATGGHATFLVAVEEDIPDEYVFSWTKIPGTDDERLKRFLRERYHIDWVCTAGIVKSEDGKIINISRNEAALSLLLNNDKSEVILKIGNIETDKFIAKEENGELNIYPDDFPKVLARLEANVRRQQWRMPTIIVPPFDTTDQECYLDGWRPGVKPYTVDPDASGAKISRATYFRRKRGRELKHTLFKELFPEGGVEDDLCARDLGELAIDASKGIMSGKIAFIHIDGNSFGRIRKKKCITPEARKDFDVCIQKCREAFLDDLHNTAHSDPDFRLSRNGKDVLRLEVLLWGGDECTIVVPAWKGLEVLERFYKITASLTFEGVPMTHRAAVIFCHHDAPILQIRRLADRLLGLTKNEIIRHFEAAFATDPTLASLDDADRAEQIKFLSNANYGNAARYLVLESFDMLRGSLDKFLERYYGKVDMSNMLLYGNRMSELKDNMHTICGAVPKSHVVKLAYAISKRDVASENELCKRLTESIDPEQRDTVLAKIKTFTKGNNAGWYLLADLWDYAKEWKA
jgi:hypothetical protein